VALIDPRDRPLSGPVADADLGPLAGLVGTWEGDEGVDVAYSYPRREVGETRFRERATYVALGPVENGAQRLFGLDYRIEAWAGDESYPFHLEVGYWLWDRGSGRLMRGFVVPRGSTILASGSLSSDERMLEARAEAGTAADGVLSSEYLAKAARTTSFACRYEVGTAAYSYEQVTVLEHASFGGTMEHTDRNVLHRVG
jgi:hypothetical protein